MDSTYNNLVDIINEVLSKLYLNDKVLLKKKMEWAVAHRIAVYLEPYFPQWDIDCEYNKMGTGNDPKRNNKQKINRPDIVIHKREQSVRRSNLLVIELKMNYNENSNDNKKLESYTSKRTKNKPYQYQYGLSIVFNEKSLTWFIDGKSI